MQKIPPNDRPLLQLTKVTYSLGYRTVLQDIDLTLHRHEILCLQGPNGAGKTTLLKTLGSTSTFAQGQLYFREMLIKNSSQKRQFLRECGYLGHEAGLFLDMTVEQNLLFFLKCRYRRLSSEHRELLQTLLKKAGLFSLMHERARVLSRGYRQRLGLVRLFVNRPTLILLDEPLTALDRDGGKLLKNLLESYCREGAAAIVATHQESFFRSIANRFLFLGAGQLIADIPAEKYNAQSQKRVENLLYRENDSA